MTPDLCRSVLISHLRQSWGEQGKLLNLPINRVIPDYKRQEKLSRKFENSARFEKLPTDKDISRQS